MTRLIHRRAIALFLSALLATFLMAACSSVGQNQAPSDGPSDVEAGRRITHAMGETLVPENPQRVVMLGPVADVLAMGVEPVGATTAGFASRDGAGELVSFIGNQADDIAVIGHVTRPSLEAITQLEPDLILGATMAKGIGRVYSQLSQIAPTVVIDTSAGADRWRQYVLAAAEALNRLDAAEALLDDYDQRIATFQQAMGDRLTTTEVSVVRFRPDVFRAYMKGSFLGAVLEDVGLPRPASQAKNEPYENLSLEQIDAIDGDALFVMQDSTTNSTFTNVKQNPLWSQLDVVQDGAVYEVSLDAWFLSSGIVGANLILNDLFEHLVPEGDRDQVEQVGALILQ